MSLLCVLLMASSAVEAGSTDPVPGKEIHWLFSGSEKSEMIFNIILMFADHYSPAPTLCSFPSTEQLNEPLNNEAAEQPQESWGPSCPYGWTLINRRCFLYIRQSKDWASAESHCLSLGANLVSVHSEYEYQRVKALIRSHDSSENPTWLGLSNCEKVRRTGMISLVTGCIPSSVSGACNKASFRECVNESTA
ncbi:hypothetical protein NFI96_029640, partial [Prochilodus magdalenae]